MLKIVLSCLLLITCFSSYAVKNVIIVTLDGFRWQEVFHGADLKIIESKKFVENSAELKKQFWADSQQQRRELIMPFLWQTIVKKGVLIGNRDIGSNMSVSNEWYFSYPGYSEIFTGIADNRINSNEKKLNSNVTFLEWLNNQPKYGHKLAAFGSWDVFPYIFNRPRSHLYINAGFEPASGYKLSSSIKLLNQLQTEIPSPWENVRLDSFTYRFAKDYLLKKKPRVMSISLGETDDFAHDGHYDQYLRSARRSDQFIGDLWQTIQHTAGYKNNTVLVITTDHGRGSSIADWQHHASALAVKTYMKNLTTFPNGIVGSNHIWFAAIGPGIANKGQLKTSIELKQNQIAATVLTLLGENPHAFNPKAGKAITEILQ